MVGMFNGLGYYFDESTMDNYEELWKKEHPDAANDAASRKAMKNWVNSQLG